MIGTQNKRLPLMLQLFAQETEGNKEKTEPVPPVATTMAKDSEENPPPDFDSLLNSNKDYQSEFDKKVAKALNTAKVKWDEEKESEKDEAKKLEKMSSEQREAYQFKKDKEQFETEKAKFNHAMLETAVGKELLSRGLDPSFAEYLTSDTAENSKARIEQFEKAFSSAVSTQLNNKMRGIPPKAPDEKSKGNDPLIMGFNSK